MQLGFREGNRTSDAHLILYSLIRRYCHKTNQKIYACFVDFKKAFDSVPRDLLFEKLLSYGVSGKFFNILKTLYKNDNCCIKVGDKITDTFLATQGVKQGSILSPLLFNIFLADLPKIFSTLDCKPTTIDNSQKVGCLVWADDLVLLSKSDAGLQNMILKLGEYSSKNHLEVNLDKTKGMIFNKPGRFIRAAYRLKDGFIYTTKSYKYLGLMFTPSGEITTALKDLKDRALRAYYKLKTKLGKIFRKDIKTSLKLFNTLVKPILLYGSDFWGCLKLPKNNPIENVQIRFYKELLGVQKQTTNVGVLLELGEIPMTIYAKKSCIKNFVRVTILKRANNVTTTAVMEPNTHSGWVENTKNCLDNMGIGSSTQEAIHQQSFIRMKDIFHQQSFGDI